MEKELGRFGFGWDTLIQLQPGNAWSDIATTQLFKSAFDALDGSSTDIAMCHNGIF